MVVNATRKPQALEIYLQSPEFIGIVRNSQIGINHLQNLTNTEVVFTKLIEGNIATEKRRF